MAKRKIFYVATDVFDRELSPVAIAVYVYLSFCGNMTDEYKTAMAELMPLLDEIAAEAEKPMPPKPLEPPANPRVWRPRKPQVSKRKPRDTMSHEGCSESDLQSFPKDTIR